MIAVQVFNQKFLITDSLKTYDWKLKKETKELLGFEVRKAECTFDSTRIATAWYAPKLPFKNGPGDYHGLPGLILEIEIYDAAAKNTEKTIFQAISVTPETSSKPIERPSKGKIISQKEFEVYLEEQSQKRMEMFESGVDKD